jgi:hypothetical protein
VPDRIRILAWDGQVHEFLDKTHRDRSSGLRCCLSRDGSGHARGGEVRAGKKQCPGEQRRDRELGDRVHSDRFSAALPRDGTYLVTVYQMGAAADSGRATAFTLDISTKGGGSASSGASSGGGGRVADGYATVSGLTAGDTLNVRSGPSTKNAVVTEFGGGRLVQILQCKQSGGQEWCEIAAHSDAGQRGWAAGRYLKNN